MDRKEAIDKIRKCLALSDSPNENEARTALLMARRLMASYKIGEPELKDTCEEEPETRRSSVTYTTVRDNWVPELMSVISVRFCCKSFSEREYGKKTRTASFVGLSSDVDVCVRAFEYTVNTIRANCAGRNAKDAYRNSYAKGFIDGLEKAYRDQDAELESVLCDEGSLTTVMAVPDSVERYSKEHFTVRSVRYRAYGMDRTAYSSGFSDGRNHLNKRLDTDTTDVTSERARLPPKG
ncbi:MAG: DUF2786 domain-containing protein [Candidatus Methanomethylophilaceae archaeon]